MNILLAMNANELIDALGGNAAVARLTGVRTSAVSNWRRFGTFPPRLYLCFARAARERGVVLPEHLFRSLSDEERSA